jgi:hypothetical protein
MERQKNKNYGITILIKGISALILLTTVANNFPKTRLDNKTRRAMNNVFVRYNSCLQAEGNHLRQVVLK